ncbi:hypothetical protein UT300018_10450 [Clostridium faecium]
MNKENLMERYYIIKGKMLELKESMENEKLKTMSMGVSHAVINFDDFKVNIHSEGLEEICLSLYFLNKEIASMLIEKDDDFKFYFDEVCVDFVEG